MNEIILQTSTHLSSPFRTTASASSKLAVSRAYMCTHNDGIAHCEISLHTSVAARDLRQNITSKLIIELVNITGVFCPPPTLLMLSLGGVVLKRPIRMDKRPLLVSRSVLWPRRVKRSTRLTKHRMAPSTNWNKDNHADLNRKGYITTTHGN